MHQATDIRAFRTKLAVFSPTSEVRPRVLALYSACLALADEACQTAVLERHAEFHLKREQFYEVVLQSYLFLGYPRMLIGAENLDSVLPAQSNGSLLAPIDSSESQTWFERGEDLCRQVYGNTYDRLKERVESIAPDIFRWMVIEGYGKVLSREGLSSTERELAIVSCLTVENRKKQLYSHIRGALNVGASAALVRAVIDDCGPEIGAGYDSALTILTELRGE